MALKYARSRHSTSDFSRSERQKLLIKAIKEKAITTGYLTNPGKLAELYSAVISHLDTDLSLAKIGELAFTLRKVDNTNIFVSALSQDCSNVKKCSPGAFLYTPDRDLFGGASVVIPENARANRLSYYDDIRRFVRLIFLYPDLAKSIPQINIITDKEHKRQGTEVGLALAKLGIPLSSKDPVITSTGTIDQSHVNIYWNESLSVGISPKSEIIEALKILEESIPYTIVSGNEYIKDDGPKIEIVLGKDASEYFSFAKPPYYLPMIQTPIVSGEKASASGISSSNSGIKASTQQKTEKKVPSVTSGRATETVASPQNQTPIPSSTIKVAPGEWEDFSGQ